MSKVLGVYVGHDPAACLLIDGRVAALIEEERLTRFKHGRPDALGRLWSRFAGRAGYFPWASVTYCLRAAGISLDELDLLVVPGEWSGEGIVEALPVLDPSRVLLATEPAGAAHHFRHALSTFLASPFEEAAVLVVDDDGSVRDGRYEAESGYVFHDRDARHELIFKNRYERHREVRHGLGWMYHAVTNLLGFSDPAVEACDAGKTMGLAPYGRASASLNAPWVRAVGSELDFSGFERWLRESGLLSAALGLRGARALTDARGGFSELAANVAYKAQAELEAALIQLARALSARSDSRVLCIAGGVALNSVANEKIRVEGGFDDVFIVPAAHDSGQALGLAYYGHLALHAHPGRGSFLSERQAPLERAPAPDRHVTRATAVAPIAHAYGGRAYTCDGIQALLEASGLAFERLESPGVAARHAARELAQRRIVGWVQGGSEYGPRALGHRSILADPSDPGMKDTLNRRVKFREEFRPFAPSVLEAAANEIFELEGSSPYMLRVVPVRASWRERVPAITHVDGTARVQTVALAQCPLFCELIGAFQELTGLPLVLNTSFNLKGMPIVESPWDALMCFLFTNMDGLYMDRFYVPAPDPHKLIFFINDGWRLALQRPVGSEAALSSIVATSPAGASSSHPVSTAVAEVIGALDGQQSVGELLGDVSPDVASRVVIELQGLTRNSLLALRTGRLRFPLAMPPSALAPNEVSFLMRHAGMVSAHLVDR